MAKISIPCLVSKANKAGRINWYWQPSAALKRAGWKSVPLGADADEAIEKARAQNRKVDEWKQGGERPAAVGKLVRQATVSALIRQYKEEGWPSVKEPGKFIEAGTRKDYASKFRTIEAWAGDVPIAAIDSERVAVFRGALMKPAPSGRWKGQVRHTAAHATLRVLRTLFAYAEQKKLIAKGANPAESFGLGKPAPRDQIWGEPAREALQETAGGHVMTELAVDLAFQIGQREADLLKLAIVQYQPIPPFKMHPDVHAALAAVPVPPYHGRPGYDPAATAAPVMGIRLRQSKTRRWVEVPIVGVTRARVEAAIEKAKAASCTTILIDDRPPPAHVPAARDWRPRPWTAPNPEAGQTRFIRRFAELRAATIDRLLRRYGETDDEMALELALEIDDLQYRDFRRTAVVYQGELGIEPHLIAAITGHDLDETLKILDTYMPRTTGMAARAIALSHARGAAAPIAQEKNG